MHREGRKKLLNKCSHSAGFTLVELMVVIVTIGILATLVVTNLKSARESSNVAVAIATQDVMKSAAIAYELDMGFFPPDVNRGWDPGFVQPLPWNPDMIGAPVAGTNCGHCPINWQTIIGTNWAGPYIQSWPAFTPWRGKYDYNYWGTGAVRFGCVVPPGVYVGIQGNYTNTPETLINPLAENKMINKGADADNCVNGESQMRLQGL